MSLVQTGLILITLLCLSSSYRPGFSRLKVLGFSSSSSFSVLLQF